MSFKFGKEHAALTIGGVLATGAIAYLIYRMEAKNAAANTQAQIDAQQQTAAEQAYQNQYLVSALTSPSIASSGYYGSSADQASVASSNGGAIPTSDPGLESLIAGFMAQPNSVALQSTPVAQLNQLPLPAGVNIPTTISQLGNTQQSNSPAKPIITSGASLAV